jgi:hypothetical protein
MFSSLSIDAQKIANNKDKNKKTNKKNSMKTAKKYRKIKT